MTVKRNFLALGIAYIIICATLVCIIMCGCGQSDYVAAEDLTDNELHVTALITTRCGQIMPEESVQVQFTDVEYNSPLGLAAMWAFGEENRIVVWRGFLRDWSYTLQTFDFYARHECCHCYYDDQDYNGLTHDEMVALEDRANACARDMF